MKKTLFVISAAVVLLAGCNNDHPVINDQPTSGPTPTSVSTPFHNGHPNVSATKKK